MNNFSVEDYVTGLEIVDELETFVGKKNKICLWTAVNPAFRELYLGSCVIEERYMITEVQCQEEVWEFWGAKHLDDKST
ncbi:hypothetical protein FM036_11975 [Nostoc sp. HG1]|nr:hypothetical protein [Nostoc sp. HG1]